MVAAMTRLALLLALLCAAPAAATPVQPRVVPGEGIAGVSLGMTRAEVRAQLGRPARVRRAGEQGVDATQVTLWTFHAYRLVVGFQAHGPRVTSVTTSSGAPRTREGVGVGTSERSLRERLRGERCSGRRGERRVCILGRVAVGRPVTEFLIVRGVVGRVTVALQGP